MRQDVLYNRILAVTTNKKATAEEAHTAFRNAIDFFTKKSPVGAATRKLLTDGFLKEVESKNIQVRARIKKTAGASKRKAAKTPARKVSKKSSAKKTVVRKARPKSNYAEHRASA